MKILSKALTIATLFCMASTLYANKMRIAVIDFKPEGVSKKKASQITELIRNHMVGSGDYQVIERSRINLLLREQGFQKSGATDEQSVIKIGRLASANKILTGSIMIIDRSIVITGRIVDVQLGIAEFSQNLKLDRKESIYQGTKLFVEKLNQKIAGSNDLSFFNNNDYNYPDNTGTDNITSDIPVPAPEKKEESKLDVNYSISSSLSTLDFYSMLGFSLNCGIMLNKNFYLGAQYTHIYEMDSTSIITEIDNSLSDKLDELYQNKVSAESYPEYEHKRSLKGGGFVFYYEGMNLYNLLIIAPGFAAGYYKMNIEWKAIAEYDTITLYKGNQIYYGGPKIRLSTGFSNVFTEFEYTLLIGPSSKMGMDRYYHLFDIGIRLIF